MFKKLRTVIYQTDDLEKTKKWYTDITGIAPYFDMPFYIGFDIHGFELGLHPGKAASLNEAQANVYWAVDDIEECVKKLVSKGAVIIEAITPVGEGTKVATVKDPWGNAVGVIEEK